MKHFLCLNLPEKKNYIIFLAIICTRNVIFGGNYMESRGRFDSFSGEILNKKRSNATSDQAC